MHATVEQLNDLRDGIPNAMASHVQSCTQCQAEMAYLDKMAGRIFDTADQAPPEDAWQRILAASELPSAQIMALRSHTKQATTNPNSSLTRAIYTLAASIAFVGLISVFMLNQQSTQQQRASNQMQASINQLMLNSRGLETVLQQVVAQNDVLSDDDRAAAERLYWKLTYVDQELQATNSASQQDAERLQILWSDRVEVLNELNRLFYQRKDNVVNARY
ncbi:hypothetical protein GCM10008090_01660 [Arenicella chitinivorans]|uniref:Uncharacterized protein n=1 Tax=Arenicella chitinivorans TaxID=1329800 RepID=A0A918REM9_9GAMM|nr:hypothetical protein [Arenicella chitinivorans]GGZ97062.1 hypothetical protein GCM10008090_01660 [Arenicella chitinivorans]